MYYLNHYVLYLLYFHYLKYLYSFIDDFILFSLLLYKLNLLILISLNYHYIYFQLDLF